MLRFKRLPDMDDKLRCHECGRQWWEVQHGYDGPDARPFVQVLGVLGCCQIRTVLCPHCVDDNASTLFDAAGYAAVYRTNREHDRDEAFDLLLARLPWPEDADEPPLANVVLKNLSVLRTAVR